MRIVMDSDCLIKLVKAQLKELVCRTHAVVIPMEVRREVVDQAAGHPESQIVQRNLATGSLTESAGHPRTVKGEDAALNVFQKGGFDAIASDDRRFARRLRILNIPYLTPGAILFLLAKDKHITVGEARDRLSGLSPMISDDERTVVRIKLDALAEKR
jgi:hypothetical protein